MGVCLTSGWNCTAKYLRVKSPMAAMGLLADFARAMNPSGMRVIRSPCDIHTLEIASSRVPGISGWISAGPYSRSAGMGNLSAEGMGEQLHPVAQAQDGQAGFEHIRQQGRRTFGIDRGRSAGEDEAFGMERQHFFGGGVPGEEFAVDVRLAHPAGDQLGVLGTEVEDGDGIMHKVISLNQFTGCWKVQSSEMR